MLGAQSLAQVESKKYIRILITELFPRLCKQRIILTNSDIHPSVKSTDGKQYISIPWNLFEQYLLLGQQYYIERREWQNLSIFTDMMLDCCGYTKLGQIRFQSSLHNNRFQYMQQKRHYLYIDPNSEIQQLNVSVAFMLEFKAIAADFIQFCNEYYRAVCMLDSPEEKSCLIPICAIKPGLKNNNYRGTNTAIQPEDYRFSSSPSAVIIDDGDNNVEDNYRMNINKKRCRSPQLPSSNTTGRDSFLVDLNNKRQKLVEFPDRGGEGLDSYCMGGVDNALQILSKAADCMRHVVELWDWASQMSLSDNKNLEQFYGGWEQG